MNRQRSSRRRLEKGPGYFNPGQSDRVPDRARSRLPTSSFLAALNCASCNAAPSAMAFTSYIRVFELRSSVRALVASVSALDWSRTALDLSMSFMPWKVLLISLQAPSRQPTLNAWIWTHDALDPPMIAGTAIASVAGMEIACTSRGVGSVTVRPTPGS